MIIEALFKHWLSLKTALLNPLLPDKDCDLFVDQAWAIVQAVARTRAYRMEDVLLKLEIYRQEIEAGACVACDLLLASALDDRSAIMGERHQQGLAPRCGSEHRPAFPHEIELPYDATYRVIIDRDEDHRSAYL